MTNSFQFNPIQLRWGRHSCLPGRADRNVCPTINTVFACVILGTAFSLSAQDVPSVNSEAAKAPASDAALVERALNDLGSGDWILQWEAVHELTERRAEQAAPKLEALLTEKNEAWLRARALIALAGIRKEAALAKALEFSADNDPVLRASALRAMGMVGAESALPSIEKGLKDPESAVSGEALIALAMISRDRAWPLVKEALASADPKAGIRALAFFNSPEASEKLLALMEVKDRTVRVAVLAALKETHPAAMIKPLMLRMSKESERAMLDATLAALSAIDPQIRNPILLDMLEAGETQLVDVVLDLLAATPGAAVCDRIEKLIARMEPGNATALPRMFRFLASYDADRYVTVFTSRLQHAKPEVRLAAIEAMGRCKKSDRFALLKPMLTDSDPRISETVFSALRLASRWAPDEGIVGYLEKALQSPDRKILKNAAMLLRDRLSGQEFLKALAVMKPYLSGNSDELRSVAIGALEQAADPEGAREIAAAQGFMTQWQVVGPLLDKAGESGVEELMTVDKEFDPAKKIKTGEESEISWGAYDVDRTDGTVELQSVLGDERMSSGFAVANFKFANPQTATAQISTEGDVTLYLNGKKLNEGKEKKQNVEVNLLGGANRIFVKVVRTDNSRATFRIRLVDTQGAAIEFANSQK